VQLRQSRRCVVLAFCLCGLAAVSTRAQDTEPTLKVSAGLGGFVKAGRWAPVRVDIDNPRGASSAELELHWGDATVKRQIALASSGIRRFDLFIRTADAGSLIRVTLRSHDREFVTEQPVTVLAHDTPVTLCVNGVDGWLPDASGCTVTLAPRELPSSARGYEIVDEVIAAEDPRALPAATRLALERWRSLRALEASGDLSLTPQVTRPTLLRGLAAASGAGVKTFAGVCIALLLLIGMTGVTTRVDPQWVWLAFALVMVIGGGAALMLGRVGPGGAIVVHHTSLLQQIAGASGSLLTLRGVAEFPSDDAVLLRLPLGDAMLEPAAPSARAAQVFDDNGYPILSGRYGLGTRQAFTAEAVTDTQWLTVIERGDVVEVSNRTDTMLRDCHFGDGMSRSDVADLPARATVSGTRQGETAGPLFTCTAPMSALMLAEGSRRVDMTGTTTVVVYRDRRLANGRGAPND
jgi:hypothetical protein